MKEAAKRASDAVELYRRHAPAVHRFVYRLAGDGALAEEITAEAFARCLSGTAPIRTETVRGYLFTIARNLYLKEVRRRARYVEIEDSMPDRTPDPGVGMEVRERLQRTRRALGELPEADRAALLMRAEHEMPYEEIARVLGLSVAAARVKVHRARRRLLEMEL